MPTDIVPVQVKGAPVFVIPRNNGSQDAIVIDNDNFDDAQDFLIEKRKIQTLGIQIQNPGGANGLSFEIYGSIDPSEVAPAFNNTEWQITNDGTGNIAALNNQLFKTAFYYVWILIRLKRQDAGLSTTAKILTTSGAT